MGNLASGMRAVRLHAVGDLRFEHAPAPAAEPPAGSVRVRVRAAGVCGSDLHNFRTGQWLSRVPITPGHEFAGEIVALGAGVSDLALGDRVVGDSRVSCGECPRCQAGQANVCDRLGYVGEVCDGAFAEWLDLPARQLLGVPPGVSLRVAALAEPLGVSLRVVRRLDPQRQAPILIAGGGPIGGLAAILLQHLGFGPLGLIERNPERAQLVADVSGARPLEPTAAAIADFTAGRGLRFAIEATGSQSMLSFLLGALAGGGRLAMVGVFAGEPAVDANAIVERELEVRGCSVFCDEQREALSLLSALAATLERVISPSIALEQLPQAYGMLLAGQSPWLKTIVEP
jgi:(R,R)-butanediol dehydrogenase / meso-butanediol dehydrogenase / diacetyl reductase